MKVNLKYNEIQTILSLLDAEVEKLSDGIKCMEEELKEVDKKRYEGDGDAAMRWEELECAMRTDMERRISLNKIIWHIKES